VGFIFTAGSKCTTAGAISDITRDLSRREAEARISVILALAIKRGCKISNDAIERLSIIQKIYTVIRKMKNLDDRHEVIKTKSAEEEKRLEYSDEVKAAPGDLIQKGIDLYNLGSSRTNALDKDEYLCAKGWYRVLKEVRTGRFSAPDLKQFYTMADRKVWDRRHRDDEEIAFKENGNIKSKEKTGILS